MQWRGAVSASSPISVPLSPIDQSLNNIQNASSNLSGTHSKINEQPQINLTLSCLGLEGSPVAPAAKFILPESAVKRNPLKKASFPSPIGSFFNSKGPPPPGLNHVVAGPTLPLQGQISGMHGHMQALFQNPFMPGIEFSRALGKDRTGKRGDGVLGVDGGSAEGEGKTSGFDALFARLTPYQQSMVSPIIWDPNNSGNLVNFGNENVPH